MNLAGQTNRNLLLRTIRKEFVRMDESRDRKWRFARLK